MLTVIACGACILKIIRSSRDGSAVSCGWLFGLPLDFGAEQSIAMRRQATTRATYNAQSPSPCRPLASGGVVSVTADAVVGEGGTHAKTYRQSIDRALESRRPGRWRCRCAAGNGQSRGRKNRIESRRSQTHAGDSIEGGDADLAGESR